MQKFIGLVTRADKRFTNQGQGFIELALLIPMLLVVVVGIFDLGRVYFSTIALVSAAREGARYLSVHPGDISNTPPFISTIYVAIDEAGNAGIPLTESQVTVSCTNSDDEPSECDGAHPAIVTVTYDFDLILGLVLPSPISVTRSAQMVVP